MKPLTISLSVYAQLLFAISSIGAAIGFKVLGTFVLFKENDVNVEDLQWIPLVSFSFAIFASSLAILNLPYVIITEIMPEHIKDFAVSLSFCVLWIALFIVVKIIPGLTELIGFPVTMFIFGTICLLIDIFIVFCVPETNGKSHDEIMNSLREM